jgi:hypothetical protein
MGWWSTDILGGDTPYDIVSRIFEICDIEQYEEDKPGQNLLNDKAIQENLDEITNYLDMLGEDKSIGYQVLAVLMMECGATISKDLKFEMIYACNEDEWAQTNEERQKSILGLLTTLEAYDNSKPIAVKSKGLLEVIYKSLEN